MLAKLPSRMRPRRFFSAILGATSLLALSVTASLAQDTPCLKRTVAVNVVDQSGRQVSGLKATDFRARFRGQPVQILSADIDAQPRRIVLLLDASGSMIDPKEGIWKLVLSVAKDAVEELSPQHSLALLVFAKKVEESVDFTESRQIILQRLSELEPGRKALPKGMRQTALWDALLEALKSLGRFQRGDVVFAITDGGENASHAQSEEVKRALLAAGVRLFVFLPVSPGVKTPEEFEGPSTLFTLASHAGGILLKDNIIPPPWVHTRRLEGEEPLTPAELRTALDTLYSAMNSFYRLEIELPRPVDKMRSWKLELANPPAGAKQHSELAYPRDMLPCRSP